MASNPKPNILILAGYDPTAGAGLLADYSAISSLHGRVHLIPTAMTIQDQDRCLAIEPVDLAMLEEQLRFAVKSQVFDCIKVGMIAGDESVQLIHRFLKDSSLAGVPVVLDPVLKTSTGHWVDQSLEAVRQLSAECTVITPNTAEYLALTVEKSRQLTAQWALISGVDSAVASDATHAVHQLLSNGALVAEYETEILPWHCHGGGCLLSSYIAYELASKSSVESAVANALTHTKKHLEARIEARFAVKPAKSSTITN